MKRVVVALSFVVSSVVSSVALADVPPSAPPTPVETPPPEAPAVVDPFAEPKKLVETEANTIGNLKKAIELYEAALKDPAVEKKVAAAAQTDIARAYLRWGDLEKGNDAKIALYEKGQAAGKKAEALDGKSAAAIFWGTANQACIGRTRGVMNSLFMIGDLKKGMNRALELDSNYHFARNTLGEIDHQVPGIAGGSDDRAEKAYLEVLKRDPHFTPTMVLLANFYKDKGDDDKAKEWAQKVLDEKGAHPYQDWVKFNKRDAKAVLNDLK